MRSRKTYLALAVATLLLGTGLAAVTVEAKRRMTPISAAIDEIIGSLDDAIRDEIEAACGTAGSAKEGAGCRDRIDSARRHDAAFRSADALKARAAEARADAERKIRTFRSRHDLALRYVGTSSDPYREDDAQIETYVDDEGFEYWISPDDERIVQMGPHAGRDPSPHPPGQGSRRPVSDLRRIAMDTITAEVPDFPQKRSVLHPLEDNKEKTVYFFRWDDFSSPMTESEIAPFIQVGVRADGSVVSYTNTLTR